MILRQPCRYYLKGTCTRSPCEYWHLPECQFYETESGCQAGDKCLFPHHKVDEQANKSQKRAIIPTKKEKATTRMLWILRKLYHNWVASRKTRSHWILKEAYSLGETRSQKFWDQFDEYGSHSLRCVKQVSGKTKDLRLKKKYKSEVLSSEVPTD